jgi:casein kinase I homolog HRR25
MELRVARKYRLGQKIGTGNNAEVYEGTNVHNGDKVALKLERIWGSSSHLKKEHKVYKTLGTQGTQK